ncbi:hypothetical protein Taro_003139 [Colocasia esculenta]|uniref:Uncharacterized protein n=1 Tax=Colocasia esculenta TaxID=4460 RepID=A0A843TL39_COLES|nr:hypothetical protein [Colocasia esculenta]
MPEETISTAAEGTAATPLLLSPAPALIPSPPPSLEQEEAASLPPLPQPSSLVPLSLEMAAAPVVRFPIVLLIRLMGVAVAFMVILWAVSFRGGMALFSDNKDLIFNVKPPRLGFPTA